MLGEGIVMSEGTGSRVGAYLAARGWTIGEPGEMGFLASPPNGGADVGISHHLTVGDDVYDGVVKRIADREGREVKEVDSEVALAIVGEPNWLGVPGGTEHRTVGPHRAWCFQCVTWCYESALCPCCDQTKIPQRWRGLNAGELLEDLEEAFKQRWVTVEPTITDLERRNGYSRAITDVLRIMRGDK